VPNDSARIERVLSTARFFLASASLLAIYIDPTEPTRFATLTYILLTFYVLHSLAVAIYARLHRAAGLRYTIFLLSVDLLWTTTISLFTEGPNSPFFLFFVFVLLSAAYRWGLRETLLTTVSAVGLLVFEAALVSWFPDPLSFGGTYEVNRLIMRATYFSILGLMLGYLAEQEKQLKAEVALIADVIGRMHMGSGLAANMKLLFTQLLQVFEAEETIAIAVESSSQQAYIARLSREQIDTYAVPSWRPLDSIQLAHIQLPVPGSAALLERGESGLRLRVADSESTRLLPSQVAPGPDFLKQVRFSRALVVRYAFADWTGQVMLTDPLVAAGDKAQLDFLARMVNQIFPVLYNVYLVRRLRARAGALERAKVARELHDGTIQALIGIEMQLDVARRSSNNGSLPRELERIQQLIHSEVLNLRDLMAQMKPVEIAPSQLLEVLSEMLERFGRETGVQTSFISNVDEVTVSPRTAREMARIVQEAIANVRRHAKATNLVVRFDAAPGMWRITVDDDGRGFEFAGRLALPELDSLRKGPVVIKERVRSLGGQLVVESTPGRGAKLEITVPQKAEVAFA